MIPNLTDWTVVTVGQWNPHIFSPEWMSRHLHMENLEAMLSVGLVGVGLRYQTPNLILIPGEDRLIIEDGTLRQMEEAFRSALQLLSHTPVRALGINFGFIENDPPAEIVQTFDLADRGALSDAGYNVRSVEIVREIDIAPATLKLKMVFADDKVRFHFNFTHQITSAEEAATLLDGRVLNYRDRAVDILTRVFQLQRQEVTQQ
ncbi:MAG: hypothetical protein C4294_05530 [Nitrospiraceae bacterium]